MSILRPRAAVVCVLAFLSLVAGPWLVGAQSAAPPLRIALLAEWSVSQHRAGITAGGPVGPELRAALDGGVVDRPVFWWQRGAIQRSALARKPIRVLAAAEASLVGGQGEFEVVVRPPSGPAAWTEVELRPRRPAASDIAVLEVGGELNTVTQVLATLLVVPADGAVRELPLVPRALIAGEGVPVGLVPFGLIPAEPGAFRGRDGLEFFVARSPVESLRDADTTTAGPADRATTNVGDWRQADRLFIRVPAAGLQAGLPGIVLGWKDRTLKSDPDGGEGLEQRRRG